MNEDSSFTTYANIREIMAAKTVHLSIAIYQGDRLDYQEYRHTALFASFANGDPSALVHVVGPPGEYETEITDNYDPSRSRSLANAVDVGPLSVQANRAHIIRILKAVPVDNDDHEFNCQTWVEAALKKLTELRMLSSESYMQGVDGMIDAIAEAKDGEN